ncbi:GPI ethanolamine phosphate transferase 2 [Erysiphe neolycopersici]|uniref:GPI ethanolamine phosphate transferase 2 n=1 Tax=Erysiphe neolycopersici TaxID=212602 RepID=A0A420I136_9PEZI|nr:GPI ethanolamine phosphate transferase 2 [Erysiphe neolycopersici]
MLKLVGDDRIQLYLRNVEQILRLLKATFPSFNTEKATQNCEASYDSIEKLACQWKLLIESVPENGNDEESLQIWQKSISMWLKQAQEIMSNVATNYDLSRLGYGMAVAIISLGLSIYAASKIIAQEIMSCFTFSIISFLYGIMMFGSSYVEEEHSFWYWATSAWLGLLLIKSSGKLGFHLLCFGLVLLRIAMRWNQTGNKFIGEPDIAKSYLLKHSTMLWLLVTISYLWNLSSLQHQIRHLKSPKFDIIIITMSTAALILKISLTDEDSPEIIGDWLRFIANLNFGIPIVIRVRLLFLILSVILFFAFTLRLRQRTTSYQTACIAHKILIFLLFTQSRVENIPLLLIFEMLFTLLDRLHLSVFEVTITTILLQQTSFFTQGGSNAISSIDLSNAYNGIINFNVLAVGALTFIGNWTGPILWTSASNLMLLRINRTRKNNLFFSHLAILTIFLLSSLTFTMAACIMLRTHLFVWTVFSPKFLYSLAWSLGQHLCINLGLGSLLYWVGTRK